VRIIAGDLRGRILVAPPGLATRPMLDRVREALFSILGDLVPGARVLDLFAGSGSLGLEALSRGAASVRFVESDPRAFAALRKNVEALVAERESVELLRGDALEPSSFCAADLAFFDPPYALFEDARARSRLLAAVHSVPADALVLHGPPRALSPAELARLGAEERKYGRSALWIRYTRASGEAAP
jgi:16S rRNA (guanine966-N2)-methyltransferase